MKRNRSIIKLFLLTRCGVIAPFILPLALMLTILFGQRDVVLPPNSPVSPDLSLYEPEVRELLQTTYLGHERGLPDPGEPLVVLKKYLEQNAHGYSQQLRMSGTLLDRELVAWQVLTHKYPRSRHALVGLAQLYRTQAQASGNSETLRQAVEAYVLAAEIALEHGTIRYTRQLSELLVELGDKESLDSIFGVILAQPKEMDHTGYYLALVDYADALALLDDDRAWSYFEEAIDFNPEANGEAFNLYARHLLDHGLAQQALEVLDRLTPERRLSWGKPISLRKEAAELVGIDTPSVDEEVATFKKLLGAKPIGLVEVREVGGTIVRKEILKGQVSRINYSIADTGTQKTGRLMKLGIRGGDGALQGVNWPAHDVASDDCRTGVRTPYCNQFFCYYSFTINMAEVIFNEAGGRPSGARRTVGWAIRNREFQYVCNASYFGGIGYRTTCSPAQPNCILCNQLPATNPDFPALSKWACCAIHGGYRFPFHNDQMNDSHQDSAFLDNAGYLDDAVLILNGNVPDISVVPPFIPSGLNSQFCTFDCGGPICRVGTNRTDPSPKGPMEWRSFWPFTPAQPIGTCMYWPSNPPAWTEANVCNGGNRFANRLK